MGEDKHKPPAPDFEQIIGKVLPRLRLYFLRGGIHRYDADDLIQETVLRLLECDRCDEPSEGRVTARVFAVAKHVLIKFHRREQRVGEFLEIGDLPPTCSTSSGVSRASELLRGVGKIVQCAFNELRGRATFRREKMGYARFDMLAMQRKWHLLHGAHPPRPRTWAPAAALSESKGTMCSRFAPAQ